MRKTQLLSPPFLWLYGAAILAITLDLTRVRWGAKAWFPVAVGATAGAAIISLLEIFAKLVPSRAGAVRGDGWIPQIEKADRRIRTHRRFPVFASLLASRGIDPARTIFLNKGFVDGCGKHDYLLILPSAKWVCVTWRGDSITDWDEDVKDDFSDDFQAELEKFRVARLAQRRHDPSD